LQTWRLLMQVAAHDIVLRLPCILTSKRWPARQHLIQHTSETIDICTVINPIWLNLLRAHIFRRTHVRPKPGASLLSHDQSNSEINEICMLIWPHEDIRWLHVPVNHTPAMGKIQRLEYATRDGQDLVQRKTATPV